VSQPAFQPPWAEAGTLIPRRLELAATEDMLVTLSHLVAYSSGLSFVTEIRLRDTEDAQRLHRPLAGVVDDYSDDTFHLVVTADGASTTSLPREGAWRGGLSLFRTSGYGSEHQWEQQWWLAPIPATGAVELVVRWPAFGLEGLPIVIDGDEVRAAATASAAWPSK
jgi:hypothetical protein